MIILEYLDYLRPLVASSSEDSDSRGELVDVSLNKH